MKEKWMPPHRQAKTMAIPPVRAFLESQGYQVLSLQQAWRHVTGRVRKGKDELYFKLASSPGIAVRTENEVSWNHEVARLLTAAGKNVFSVPETFETGKINGLFYQIDRYLPGRVLADKNPPDTSRLPAWLDRIISCNLFLLSLAPKSISLYRDRDSVEPDRNDMDGTTYVERAYRVWLAELGGAADLKLESLFEVASELARTYEPGVNHGDFVPWHMIEDGDGFVLIDGEHASARTPRYYDISYFFRGLYTGGGNPDLAKEYLQKVKIKLPAETRASFERSITPLIAGRILGGYRDKLLENKKDFGFLDQARDELLKGKLFD